MPLTDIPILVATGLFLGFLSGLLGIGGGIIMTPVQFWLYTSAGLSTDLAIRISFATTLAVILPTAASGVWGHHRQKAINWRAAIFMGIFTSICAFGGASLAVHLPGHALKIAFGALALIIALRMLTVRVTDTERPTRNNPWLWVVVAVPIGLITGILGIGGGIMVVPALVLALGFRMRNAVATSLAIMLFTSTGAIIGYVVNGIGAEGLPAHTIGYIYWPAWLALTVSSMITAQLGAIYAHRIPGRILNYIFIALVLYVSLNMLGVIHWISAHLF
jgi:uncharacterized membrane protein YfcA